MYWSFDEYKIYWEYLCHLIKIRTDCSWELTQKYISTLPTQGHKLSLLILWHLKMHEHGVGGSAHKRLSPRSCTIGAHSKVFAFGKNCLGLLSIVTQSPMLNHPSSSPPLSLRVNKPLFLSFDEDEM